MGAWRGHLTAGLATAWEAEVVAARRMTELATRIHDARLRSRVLVQAAFCRAHASRLLARLSMLGRGPLPVPPSEVEIPADARAALLEESRAAIDSAARYRAMAEAAREQGDTSSAWVCELNHAEELDRSEELRRIAQADPAAFEGDLTGAGAV
jgi:hypothetical protein